MDVALEGGPVEIVGALGFDRSDAGLSPRRLPEWTRPQIPDLFMDGIVRMPSGVRLRFATDSTHDRAGRAAHPARAAAPTAGAGVLRPRRR